MPEVKLLMTHPGVGPITALTFVLVIGTPERFDCGKQVARYLGLIPCEASSAERWRLGHISKQGNKLLRFLLGQSAQSVVRCEEQWHRQYAHLSLRRNKLIAKVAMARKLAGRLFWMWRLCLMKHRRHYAAFRNTPRESAVTRVRCDLRVQDAA
jgi:transposase